MERKNNSIKANNVRKWKIDPTRTLMIGDRTNTDIKFGKTNGLKTMLVLSGCHHLEEVMQNQMTHHMEMVPDYFAACLGALLPEDEDF